MPRVCSAEAPLMRAMIADTRSTAATISAMVSPAWAACSEPRATSALESTISVRISLASRSLFCASSRTSSATTAKPLPCSPARAASTEAFSARILV